VAIRVGLGPAVRSSSEEDVEKDGNSQEEDHAPGRADEDEDEVLGSARRGVSLCTV
jgi:hypothetical protein